MTDDSELDDNELDEQLADDLLAKIRSFSESLGSTERQMFAILLSPGVEHLVASDDVTGFLLPINSWAPRSLRERLAAAIAARGNPAR